MLDDKFTVNGKEYSVKKELTFGEYRKISGINNKLANLSEQFGKEDTSQLSDEELGKVAKEFTKTSDEQLEIIVNFLESILGLKQKEIDSLGLNDAMQVFQKAFKASTEVKKKLEMQSD